MNSRADGSITHLPTSALAGALLLGTSSFVHAGTLKGMNDPNRVPGAFIVMLRRDHIVALGNPVLIDPHEKSIKSPKWQAATAAVDTEVAQMVRKLAKAHPHARVAAIMSEGMSPGFVLKASDEDARAMANEADVAEVDADMLLKKTTLTIR